MDDCDFSCPFDVDDVDTSNFLARYFALFLLPQFECILYVFASYQCLVSIMLPTTIIIKVNEFYPTVSIFYSSSMGQITCRCGRLTMDLCFEVAFVQFV